MEAGKLDRRVQFRRSTLSDNGLTEVETWADHGTPVWASKVDVSDGEKLRADQVAANLTSRFIVRRNSFSIGLTAKDQITYGGDTFSIYGIKEIDSRSCFEITAGARVDLAQGDA
jgi:SPP1 family predicted phage head-tail adaptor